MGNGGRYEHEIEALRGRCIGHGLLAGTGQPSSQRQFRRHDLFRCSRPRQHEAGIGLNRAARLDCDRAGRQSVLEWTHQPFGITASEGDYWLDFTGFRDQPPFAGVAQTIATQIGQQYLLTFDLGSSAYQLLQDGLRATAGSSSHIFTSTNPGVNNLWQPESMQFTATGNLTLISLLGNSGSSYIGLDNVSVTPVAPVPIPNIGSGLPGIVFASGLLAWWRKRRAQHSSAFANTTVAAGGALRLNQDLSGL